MRAFTPSSKSPFRLRLPVLQIGQKDYLPKIQGAMRFEGSKVQPILKRMRYRTCLPSPHASPDKVPFERPCSGVLLADVIAVVSPHCTESGS